MENKKVTAKSYYEVKKVKIQKRLLEYYSNLSDDDKIKKKRVMLTLELKHCQAQIEKEKKNI